MWRILVDKQDRCVHQLQPQSKEYVLCVDDELHERPESRNKHLPLVAAAECHEVQADLCGCRRAAGLLGTDDASATMGQVCENVRGSLCETSMSNELEL